MLSILSIVLALVAVAIVSHTYSNILKTAKKIEKEADEWKGLFYRSIDVIDSQHRVNSKSFMQLLSNTLPTHKN